MQMTDDQANVIAQKAAEAAVVKTLLSLGIDVSSPSGVLEAQRDFQHIRAWRKSTETVKRQGLVTAAGIVVAAMIGLIWMAVTRGTP